jgi:hypothetical protein
VVVRVPVGRELPRVAPAFLHRVPASGWL